MDKAVECLLDHIENNDKIFIQEDCDADGITSASILYNYLKTIFPKLNIFCSIHSEKQHGLNIKQVKEDIKLVIVPDAIVSDEDILKLEERNIDCINLDHHINTNLYNDKIIVVNNQMSKKYPNKELSGVGIVYKFLQALDDELWEDHADDFLDLVAIGNIADMMDCKSLETKYYINKGLKQIKNKFLKELIKKQDFSLKGKLNQIGVSFYIAPLINAIIRLGTKEDKENLFKAFTNQNEVFLHKKKNKEIENENIYQHMARICINIKNKQNRNKEKESKKIIEKIRKKGLDKNKLIIYVMDNEDKVENTMIGLIAMQLVSYYMKPVILLRKNKDNELTGSIRGLENSELNDFRRFLLNLNICEWVEGHPNAAGICVKENNLNKLIKKSNEKLKNINFDKVYTVDYIVPYEELSNEFIQDIYSMRDIWGQGLKESLVAITNIKIPYKNIKLFGKNTNTLTFKINDTKNIEFIKFNIDMEKYYNLFEGYVNEWDCHTGKDIINLDVIGRCNINTYDCQRKCQIIISDLRIRK